jgi:hypothetical protein
MGLRTRLVALFAVFVAVGLLTGTGAFSSVSAERTVSVNVAGDASALLALEPHQSSANGAGGYASTTSNGEIEINFDGVSASGVNLNARTVLDRVFNVTNQGTQSVDLWIAETGANTTAVTFYEGTVGGGTAIPTSQSSTVTLSPGESIEVSIEVDTQGTSDAAGDQLLSSVTVHAEA